jgi:hypothetical protein
MSNDKRRRESCSTNYYFMNISFDSTRLTFFRFNFFFLGAELPSFSVSSFVPAAAVFRFFRAPFLSDFVPPDDDKDVVVFAAVPVEAEVFF